MELKLHYFSYLLFKKKVQIWKVQLMEALKLQYNESNISSLSYCNVQTSEMEKKAERGLGTTRRLLITWKQYKLEANFKKCVEFKKTKWLDKSDICHLIFHILLEDRAYDILIKNYDLKKKKKHAWANCSQ